MKSACNRLACRAFALAAVLPMLTMLSPAWGRGFTYKPIDEKILARLPEAAQDSYHQAIEAVDHVDYDTALDNLGAAVKAAPNSPELRFLTLTLARYRAQMTTGVESARFLDTAIENAKALLAIPNLPSRQRQWAEYEMSKLDVQRKTVDERDEARRTYGMQIARQYAKQVYSTKNQSAEIKKYQDAIKSLTQGGTSSAAASAAKKALAATASEKSNAKAAAPAVGAKGEAAPPVSGAAPAPAPAPPAPTAPVASQPAPPAAATTVAPVSPDAPVPVPDEVPPPPPAPVTVNSAKSKTAPAAPADTETSAAPSKPTNPFTGK